MTKPTLNYRSKTEAVMALKAQGLNPREVADKLGVSVSNVETLSRYARDRGFALPVEVIETILPDPITRALKPAARSRRVTVNRLIVLLLTAIAEEKMVDAVLDDRGAA